MPTLVRDRLSKDAGDIAVGEFLFERGEVVEFNHARGLNRIYRGADVPAARARDAVVE